MTVTLPLPPPLNAMYRRSPRGRGMYKTPECEAWEKEAVHKVKREYPVFMPKGVKVGVGVDMFLKNDRDIDSSLKLLLDSLQGICYENDSQVVSLLVNKSRDREPRIVVTITALP